MQCCTHLSMSHVLGTEACETSPEECHLDYVCGVHEEGNCSECYCTPGYSGEECISKYKLPTYIQCVIVFTLSMWYFCGRINLKLGLLCAAN